MWRVNAAGPLAIQNLNAGLVLLVLVLVLVLVLDSFLRRRPRRAKTKERIEDEIEIEDEHDRRGGADSHSGAVGATHGWAILSVNRA